MAQAKPPKPAETKSETKTDSPRKIAGASIPNVASKPVITDYASL